MNRLVSSDGTNKSLQTKQNQQAMANKTSKSKRKKQHLRRATDPGSSTEEEFKDLQLLSASNSSNKEQEGKVRITQRLTHQKSLIFHVIRYPLLLAISLLCLLNLFLYTFSRSIVVMVEYLWSFLNTSIHRLERELYDVSRTYQEFYKLAQRLDEETGANKWKLDESDEVAFDETLLINTTKRLIRDSGRNRTHKLMETLRNSACKADLAGIENEILYSRCYSGTKFTVDGFCSQVIASLEHVYEATEISAQEKADFFKQVSVTYGRTALCLSGGATLGYFHLGVMKALLEQGLLPSIVTGTSAGAMMAAMVCVRTDDELHEIFDPALASRINCLATKLVTMMKNFVQTGAMLDDELFRK